MTVWYRYWDRNCEDGPYIGCSEYVVMSETDKTVLLRIGYSQQKRVLKDARKRWAYPTKELALESYRERKRRQVQHLAHQHDHAVACRDMAKLITVDMTPGLNLFLEAEKLAPAAPMPEGWAA